MFSFQFKEPGNIINQSETNYCQYEISCLENSSSEIEQLDLKIGKKKCYPSCAQSMVIADARDIRIFNF